MQPCELALVMASDIAKTTDEQYPLDKIRMQKAIFLVAKRGTGRLRGLYQFEPYNWGPYSGVLTSDLKRLVWEDRLTIEKVAGRQHGAYSTTYDGEHDAAVAWDELSSGEQLFIRSVRAYVTSKSFNHLLREVYAEYPDFATKSQFTG